MKDLSCGRYNEYYGSETGKIRHVTKKSAKKQFLLVLKSSYIWIKVPWQKVLDSKRLWCLQQKTNIVCW